MNEKNQKESEAPHSQKQCLSKTTTYLLKGVQNLSSFRIFSHPPAGLPLSANQVFIKDLSHKTCSVHCFLRIKVLVSLFSQHKGVHYTVSFAVSYAFNWFIASAFTFFYPFSGSCTFSPWSVSHRPIKHLCILKPSLLWGVAITCPITKSTACHSTFEFCAKSRLIKNQF